MFAGSRGGVGYSRHLAVFMAKARVGLHESIVLERRGSAARGIGLFARDALDAGTSVAVVPNDRLVCSDSLRTIGCNYPLSADAKGRLFDSCAPIITAASSGGSGTAGGDGSPSVGLISRLLGCDSDAEWVELAWRLGLERCGSHSFWWGWLDGLASAREFGDLGAACAAAVRVRFPTLSGQLEALNAAVREEILLWYGRLEEEVTVPPLSVFEWAVRVVLTRASMIIRPVELASSQRSVDTTITSSSSSQAQQQPSVAFARRLGILPVIDACNTSNTAFISSYEDRLEAFVDTTFESVAKELRLREGDALPAALGEDRLRQAFLQLESRDNPYFFSPPTAAGAGAGAAGSSSLSSSRVRAAVARGNVLTAAGAAEIAPNKGVVEIAPAWEALPRWYQDLVVAETLETERAASIGMTSSGPIAEPRGATGGLFPAFVLTLTHDVRAGEEILIPYDGDDGDRGEHKEGGDGLLVPGNPNADRAMRLWLRYGISS